MLNMFSQRKIVITMKKPIALAIKEYKRQMQIGDVPRAYQALMKYLLSLKSHFANKHPETFITGAFYQGYMNMSYFPLTPKSLKSQKLKFGLVFDHEKFQFEIWLCGRNKQIQKNLWSQIKDDDWGDYYVPPVPQDFALSGVLHQAPDFDHPDDLTEQIEQRAMKFIHDIMNRLLSP